MVGVITTSDINAIIDEYGLAVAVRATFWTGTFLAFLVSEGLL